MPRLSRPCLWLLGRKRERGSSPVHQARQEAVQSPFVWPLPSVLPGAPRDGALMLSVPRKLKGPAKPPNTLGPCLLHIGLFCRGYWLPTALPHTTFGSFTGTFAARKKWGRALSGIN